jgi:hypothetical protein
MTDDKPCFENRRPAFIICPRSQFGHIIHGRVSFYARQLSEIIDGMAAIGGAAAYAEKKKPSTSIPQFSQGNCNSVDAGMIYHFRNQRRLFEKLL